MKYLLRISLVAIFAGAMFVLQNCGTSTKVMGSWANPDVNTKYGNIMVVGLTDNVVARKNVESQLVAALKSQGVDAVASISVFPPNFMKKQPSKDEIVDMIRKNGHDGIMTVALLDEKVETRYVPGTTYSPMRYGGYYGSFGGYYGYYGSTFYDPGYYTTDKSYVVETNLYDSGNENLAWSAQTETYDPSNPEKGAESLSRALADRIKRDGVLTSSKAN